MMQFKVPQDVLRPDRIVGFLTLRQLVIVMIGGGLTYSIFLILSKQYAIEIWLLPTVFLGLITAAFAFFTFQDIVFEKFILIFLEYKFKPQKRTWQKMRGDVLFSTLTPRPLDHGPAKKSEELTELERRKKLEAMSKIVDTHGKEILIKNK